MKTHITNTHKNISSVTCEICFKSYKETNIQSHMKIHTGKKTIKCDTCEMMFKTNQTRNTHMETHKENRERKIVCKLCKKSYMTVFDLRKHLSSVHSTEKSKSALYVGKNSSGGVVSKSI